MTVNFTICILQRDASIEILIEILTIKDFKKISYWGLSKIKSVLL
jgi:hypothetical protein